MEKIIKVSIIVPVYNVENYLEKCLTSLLNQTMKDIEIICVNDGSTDNSLQIIESFAQKDSRIKVIKQENKGVSVARNEGFKIAEGEYIGFVDSDDWVDLDYFEKLYNAAMSNNSDIATASIVRQKNDCKKYRIRYITENSFENLQEKLNVCDIPNCCYVCNKIFKKELIKDRKFKEAVYFEDVLWLPEVIKKANKITTVGDVIYYYRVNPNSIVRGKSTLKKQNDSYIAKKYIVDFFEENNIELSKKERNITKSIKYLLKIPYLKIKEYKNTETWYLFSILPIYNKQI